MVAKEDIWQKTCSLRLFWTSLFALTSILLIATIIGFALVGWAPQTPEFAILSFNFTSLSLVVIGVAVIIRSCNKRNQG